MNPGDFGKKLGIGLRVAGRIAQQRVESGAPATTPEHAANQSASQSNRAGAASAPPIVSQLRNLNAEGLRSSIMNSKEMAGHTQKFSRAAGRGVGGFLRPFGRVGGLLWLEVTGFFFGMFAIYFATDVWRTRLSYASGPQHNRFLMGAVATVIFAYLSASAFWRARRK